MAIGRGLYKYVATEHVLIVYMLAYSPIIPTQTQYIEKRIIEQLGVINFTQSKCDANKSSPEYRLREKVQQESSVWSLYLTATLALAVIFSANIWGALSDKYGRHVALVMPCVGLAANSAVNLLVVYFHLPLYVLIFGSLAQGIGGDITTFIVGCAGYNSDVTMPESRERTIRFILIDVFYCFAGSICQFSLGFIIRTFGFEAPYLSVIGFVVITAGFIICLLPDRRVADTVTFVNSREEEVPSNPLNIVKNVRRVFTQDKLRGWLLAGFNYIIFSNILVSVAWVAISVLYTTGEPFCMDPLYEGYYQGTMNGIYGIGVLFGGTVVCKYLSKFWSMHLASLTIVASLVITAVAQNYLTLYLGLAAGFFTFLTTPLCRTSMANLVGPNQQGVVFAFSGCLMSLAGFLSPIIFNAIYSSTLHFMTGFVYLTMALLVLISWGVIVLLHIFEPKRRNCYVAIDGQDVAGVNSDKCA
ncbi:proton-coupled folate transporter-like [Patiria miniata]|uniref:Proton-coupled folate transporter n=1 Tax=Patiria miniata TaxID=46514 RepID=A0A914AQ77_PATMI|nr:proton-coupled folate transporter-like [Patiria miniata]XP_038065794.1 proton-coupled folate transporter-like [Patiria miniata]